MLKNKLRNKKGAAVEWAIVFGFVMFAVLLMLTTTLFSINFNVVHSKNQSRNSRMYDQIRESFIHSVERGLKFDDPENNDIDTQNFITYCKNRGYNFSEQYAEKSGNQYYRILTVKDSAGHTAMTLIVKETKGDTKSTKLDITRVMGETDISSKLSSLGLQSSDIKTTGIDSFLTRRNDWHKTVVAMIECTVSFDLNGGTGKIDPIKTKDRTCTLPPEPAVAPEGQMFVGWSDGSLTYPAGAQFTPGGYSRRITLKAIWIRPCTVNIMCGTNGTVNSTTSVKIEKVPEGTAVKIDGSKITVNGTTVTASPNRGYEFSEWKAPEDYIIKTNPTNITALWKAKTYSINFINCDNSASTYTYNTSSSTTVPLTTPTKPYNDFDGWAITANSDPEASISGSMLTIPEKAIGNITLSAKWKPQWKVTFNYNDGSTSSTAQYVSQGKSINLQTLSKSGYVFKGWSDGTKTYTGSSYTPTGNVTLEALWKELVMVKFDYNGGSGSHDPVTVESGSSVSLPTPSRSGYNFKGWTDGSTTHTGSYTATKNITLTAKWAKVYTVSYDYNGISGSPASASAESGGSVTLPTPTRSGYNFKGWTDGSTTYTGSYKVSKDVTLTAKWVKVHTVSYDYNGGSGSPSSVSTENGGSVTLPSPSRTGYNFNGWYTAKSGGTKRGGDGASYTPTQSETLYAQWTKQYTVTISKDNASVTVTNNSSGAAISSGSYVNGGTVLKFTVTYSKSSSQTITVTGSKYYTDAACTKETTSNSEGTYYCKVNAENVTIEASSASCVASDTLITLADGSKKKVQDLTLEDKILCFNHETGTVEAANINFIENDGYNVYDIINLCWSNGDKSRIIDEHGFFDLTLNKYVYIHANDYEEYIGHSFAGGTYENGKYKPFEVTLENAYVTTENTGCYSFPSVYHLNFYMEDMLSMPGGITGMFNIFEYGLGLKYDPVKMASDIKTYGLFDYENVAEYMSYETFCTYPSKYVNISIGKGIMNEEDLYNLIERYAAKYEH